MDNKTEKSTPAQVNQSFLEFHDILESSNPIIARQLMAGISETDPGNSTNPPEWHQPRNTAIQQINDALQEAGKNWQPNHQRQVADLVASGLTAWAKAATRRQRAQNPEDILNPQVLLDLPEPALFHRTILSDPWQLSSHTRRIAKQLQENNPRYAIYALMALHARVHKSIRKETTDLKRWRKIDRDPEINRCTVHRRTTIVIAGFINNLWQTDPDLLMELDQAGQEEPTSDNSWHQSASSQEALEKILAAFAASTADLSPLGDRIPGQHPGPPPRPSHNDRSRRDGRHRAGRRPGGGSNQSPAATGPQRTGESLPPTPTSQASSPRDHLKYSSSTISIHQQ